MLKWQISPEMKMPVVKSRKAVYNEQWKIFKRVLRNRKMNINRIPM